MYGIPTYFAYDQLQRQIKTNRLGVTTETRYNGLTTETHRYPETVTTALSATLAGTSANLVSRSVSNLSGTLQESWTPNPTGVDQNGQGIPGALVKSSTTSTTYLPAAGLSTRTITTTADNFTQTTDSFLDGRVAATSGDLSPAMVYSYSANATGEFTKQAYTVGTTYYEATGSQSDWAGRTLKSGALAPGTGAVSNLASCVLQSYVSNEYNNLGQLVKSSDPDGVTTLLAYNAKGERTITATDLNANGQIDYGTDTVQSSETVPALDQTSTPVILTTSKVWQPGDTNPAAGTIVSTSSGAPNGLSSTSQTIGVANPATTVTVLGGNGNWTTTSTRPDGTKNVQTYTAGLLASSANLDTSSSILQTSSFGYDSLNRRVTSTDGRTGASTTAYLSATADIVTIVTDPGNRVTAFTYDIRGRRTAVNAPDSLDAQGTSLANVTTTSYFPDGNVQETGGDQTYRVTYTYDYADRRKTLTTYQSATESSTTTWFYSLDRGYMTRKEYADGKGTDYTYTNAGRLLTRVWARPNDMNAPGGARLTTTYGYTGAGRLSTTNYSDVTPDVAISYDCLGRKTSVSNSLATTLFAYDPATLAVDTETIIIDPDGSGGPIPSFTRLLDRGRDNLQRDVGWQLKDGSTVEYSSNYGYGSTDGRLTSVTSPAGTFSYSYLANSNLIDTVTGPVHVVTNTWEATRNVLDVKDNSIPSTTTPISRFDYGVNNFGQRTGVSTSGSAFQSQPADWNWGYDALGQVVSADSPTNTFDRAYEYDQIGNRKKSADGTLVTTGSSATAYDANNLNQYSQISGPSVSSVVPIHDQDGNATSYPLPIAPTTNATLAYDGENRLVSVTTGTTTVTYAYDAQSRRVARTDASGTTLYLYDAWNCLAEYTLQNSSFNLQTSHTWGLDLSGSIQGAGGVGGLLSVSRHQEQSATHFFPTFDGNGNVSEYLDASASTAAHYEYDPFGNSTDANGPNAADFEYRFSTKPVDGATGLRYYGYRWLDSRTGNWINRDPIGEKGGLNLYGFVKNNGVNLSDLLGLAWTVEDVLKILCCPKYKAKVEILAKLTVRAFPKLRVKWEVNGKEEWRDSTTKKGFTRGLGTNRIYVSATLSAQEAATTLIHEMVHTGQDPKMDRIEAEVEAHAVETQFQHDKGLATRKGWIDENGKVNRDVIREYLKSHPIYSPPVGEKEVGTDFPEGLEKREGWDCARVGL